MASLVYNKTKEAMLQGTFVIGTANVKAALLDLDHYTVDADHDFLDHVTADAAAIVDTSGNLASKTYTDGVFDAANITLLAVTGPECGAVLVYADTGTPDTSRLLCYLEPAAPLVPDGSDVELAWDAAGIFSL